MAQRPLAPDACSSYNQGHLVAANGNTLPPSSPAPKGNGAPKRKFPPHGVASQTCSATLRTSAENAAFLTCRSCFAGFMRVAEARQLKGTAGPQQSPTLSRLAMGTFANQPVNEQANPSHPP